MKFTLEALEVLDAIDKKGSFSGAADLLLRAPSSVTYTIQKLEEDLGFAVFRREGRRCIITPAGQVILDQGRVLLVNAQSMLETAHQVNSGWEPNLNIAVDTVCNIEEICSLIIEFQALNTGVQVNVFEEILGGSLEAIIEDKVDIAIGGPFPVTPIQGVKFEPIFTSNWLFVVAKDHPLNKLSHPINEEDIQRYPSIVIRNSSKNTPLSSQKPSFEQPVITVTNMNQKILAQIQGVGVGFLPEHKIKNSLHSGDLVPVDILDKNHITPHYCSWKTTNKGKAMRWFIDKIVQEKRITGHNNTLD